MEAGGLARYLKENRPSRSNRDRNSNNANFAKGCWDWHARKTARRAIRFEPKAGLMYPVYNEIGD
jgi:hypothetical protein